ncbi:MAG: GTPase [Planctomycetaceae bacterium]
MSPFGRHADIVRRLHTAVLDIQREAGAAGVAPLAGREWFELLEHKLLPQLTDDAYLVVAVVGGTNIGKSVIFNHIAGANASATSPLASGTKHPVCLTPIEFAEQHNLQRVFPGFEILRWERPEAALEESPEHRLFWRENSSTPSNLLVIDTPDVDSDARINWQRADQIRRSADLLIAVLTQQKYNDAAVKQFFRHAAAEDKAVIIVFNQCLLPEDEPYWPRWLETFISETGVAPIGLYVAPNDRRAAESLQLPFFARTPPASPSPPQGVMNSDSVSTGGEGRGEGPSPTLAPNSEPHSLLTDLSQVRFTEVKLRALRGALRHIADEELGAPAYLRDVSATAADFRAAAQLLSAQQLAEVDTWPNVPNAELISAIRGWWQEQRSGWSAKVHGFYNVLSQGLTWPVRFARDRLRGEQQPPWEQYRAREWSAILTAVERVYEKLSFVAQLGNDVLRPRLDALLAGAPRAAVLSNIAAAHAQVDFEQALSEMVQTELADFRETSPGYYDFFRKLDQVAAAARPVTSVVLFVTGFAPVGHALTPVITDTALQGILHVAGDVAGGTISAAVGDVVISGGAATGAGYLEARFRRLHSAFAASRAAWLGDQLSRHVLGSLPDDIRRAAGLTDLPAFRAAQTAVQELRSVLKDV